MYGEKIASNVSLKVEENFAASHRPPSNCLVSQRGKISTMLHFAQRLHRMRPEYLEISDIFNRLSSLQPRVLSERNFRLLASRREIILSGIFLPGASRRHRRRRYRGTVTIVDVKVTRGREREIEKEKGKGREREKNREETVEGREIARPGEGMKSNNAGGGKEEASRVYRCVCRRTPRGNVN